MSDAEQHSQNSEAHRLKKRLGLQKFQPGVRRRITQDQKFIMAKLGVILGPEEAASFIGKNIKVASIRMWMFQNRDRL